MNKTMDQEIEALAENIEKSTQEPMERAIQLVKSLGKAGLQARMEHLSDDEKIILKSVLEEMSKAVSFDKEADGAKVVKNNINESVIQEEVADDDADEKLVKPEAAKMDHQGTKTPGWEGQVIKSSPGEGSRGGKVVGHTSSGKPIYDDHGHADHASFSKEDHMDAAKLHHNKMMESSKGEEVGHHGRQSDKHLESTGFDVEGHDDKRKELSGKRHAADKDMKSKRDDLASGMTMKQWHAHLEGGKPTHSLTAPKSEKHQKNLQGLKDAHKGFLDARTAELEHEKTHPLMGGEGRDKEIEGLKEARGAYEGKPTRDDIVAGMKGADKDKHEELKSARKDASEKRKGTFDSWMSTKHKGKGGGKDFEAATAAHAAASDAHQAADHAVRAHENDVVTRHRSGGMKKSEVELPDLLKSYDNRKAVVHGLMSKHEGDEESVYNKCSSKGMDADEVKEHMKSWKNGYMKKGEKILAEEDQLGDTDQMTEDEKKSKEDHTQDAAKDNKKTQDSVNNTKVEGMAKSFAWTEENALLKANTLGRNFNFNVGEYLEAVAAQPATDEEVKKSEGKEDINDLIVKSEDKSWDQVKTQRLITAHSRSGHVYSSFEPTVDIAALMGLTPEEAKKILGE
jgi:hypothetical protein